MAVHVLGNSCNMQAFERFLLKHPHVVLIEDTCESLGSLYDSLVPADTNIPGLLRRLGTAAAAEAGAGAAEHTRSSGAAPGQGAAVLPAAGSASSAAWVASSPVQTAACSPTWPGLAAASPGGGPAVSAASVAIARARSTTIDLEGVRGSKRMLGTVIGLLSLTLRFHEAVRQRVLPPWNL